MAEEYVELRMTKQDEKKKKNTLVSNQIDDLEIKSSRTRNDEHLMLFILTPKN